MPHTLVRCERRPHGGDRATLHLTLHSDDGHNRLGRAAVAELRAGLRHADDATIALVVIAAEGQAFCSGGDQQEFAAMDAAAFRGFAAELAGLYRVMLACPAPVLARVHGHAVGGGAMLALSCDMVVAADGVKFAFPEARLGLAGPGFLLGRSGAYQRFAGMCFGGRSHGAQELQAIGLVNKVVEAGGFDAECDAFVEAVLRQPPAGLRATKASLAAAAAPMLDSLEQHFEIQARAFEAAA
ncbi:MAG: enoyl-CoA hydratase/isomerase family protein [Burkholderiales bacterium]|nr:enoyl-CoA hydratase/isomerase family protein [Burkholderiales bacterium]